ncbi:MAG: M17 family metallopeptidase, partial [Elusimicrobiota bacterium]
LAEAAKGLAGSGVTVRVIEKEEAADLRLGSFLGVARGSVHPPALVHLIYKPKGAKKKIALVGKGITFDSGGLSLKPPQGMETMKCDMAGAALVLGVFKVLARLKPKVEVHGYAVMTYNLPAADAYKPGDVLRARNGKTIEVLNTDAEGRLVLADALCLAAEEKPDAIVDFATLTGAVLIALGSSVTGAMTNDKALLARLSSASRLADEPLWELPLPKEYEENIKGKIADLQNIGKVRGEAGTLIGGLFLREFVGSVPWVHLDIAGTAWTDSEKPYCPAGGTGAPVRTVLEYLSAY